MPCGPLKSVTTPTRTCFGGAPLLPEPELLPQAAIRIIPRDVTIAPAVYGRLFLCKVVPTIGVLSGKRVELRAAFPTPSRYRTCSRRYRACRPAGQRGRCPAFLLGRR